MYWCPLTNSFPSQQQIRPDAHKSKTSAIWRSRHQEPSLKSKSKITANLPPQQNVRVNLDQDVQEAYELQDLELLMQPHPTSTYFHMDASSLEVVEHLGIVREEETSTITFSSNNNKVYQFLFYFDADDAAGECRSIQKLRDRVRDEKMHVKWEQRESGERPRIVESLHHSLLFPRDAFIRINHKYDDIAAGPTEEGAVETKSFALPSHNIDSSKSFALPSLNIDSSKSVALPPKKLEFTNEMNGMKAVTVVPKEETIDEWLDDLL